MAMLFLDSFDHYATADIAEKWTSVYGAAAIDAAYARHGIAGANNTGNRRVTLGDQTTLVCGMAVKPLNLYGVPGQLFTLGSGKILTTPTTSAEVSRFLRVRVSPSGALEIVGGTNGGASTVLGVSLGFTDPPYILQEGVWAFVEVKMSTIGASSTITLRINEQTALTVSGNTRVLDNVGTVYSAWDFFEIGGAGNVSLAVDDLYVGTLSGGTYNDFLGEIRVDAHYPTGPGAHTEWSRVGVDSGANWNQVNETAPNDDTDANSSSTVNQIDTFDCTNFIPEGYTLLAVQHVMAAKKTDAGVATMAPVIRQDSTDYVGTTVAPGQSAYTFFRQLYETPPAGSLWDEPTFEAMEIGYKRLS